MTRVVRWLCLFCATASVCLAASAGYPAYERANRLFAGKKLAECQGALEEALTLDPRLVPALTLKAKVAMALNRFDVARECLEKALAVDPASTYAQFLYGLQFYMENDLQSALPQFEKAAQLDPHDARATLYLGLTKESLGQTADALALYEKARHLEEAPGGGAKTEVLLPGARLLLLLGRFDESEAWIRQGISVAPNLRDIHFLYTRLLLEKRLVARAAAEGERALALSGDDVTDAQVHYLLIQAYRGLGNAEQMARHADALRMNESGHL